MKSTLFCLMLSGALLLFDMNSVAAWNRQLYQRYSRNLYRNNVARADNLLNGIGAGAAGDANNIDELTALFSGATGGGGLGGGGGGIGGVGGVAGGRNPSIDMTNGPQEQTEVYGIVEPLIEDLPCVDRPCTMNDDCCPSGVCIKQYNEAKCIYAFGRKHLDFCHRHSDCELGMSCLKGSNGNLICQPTPISPIHFMNHEKPLEYRQFDDECYTSTDCNVAKGMCCQLQRSHNRLMPKKVCTYFRNPFMCIEIMPTGDEDTRDAPRYLSSFNQKRM